MADYYSSYKSLFKIKWRICSIGDKALPRPIPLDALFMFLLLLIPSIVAAMPLEAIFHQNKIALGFILDGLFTWVCLGFDPQGRSFLSFVCDLVAFFFRKKSRDFTGSVIPRKRRIRMTGEIQLFE